MSYIKREKLLLISGIALIIGVFLFPKIASKYMLLVINNTIIYFIASLGITLLLGMCGQMSFSAVAFMGLSGFISAKLSTVYEIHPLISAVFAVVVSGIIANLLGRVLLKLKGSFFTFATIGLVQISTNLFLNWKLLSEGADGISGVPKLDLLLIRLENKTQWFYFLVFVGLLCAGIIERIRKTYLGRAAASVRDNEIAACTLGVDVYKTKVICFTIASTLAALAGTLLVYHSSYAVESMFTYDVSVNFVLMVMLGGVNSTAGTLFGSVLMTLLPEVLRSSQHYLRLIYGIGIILLMIFMPMGLAGVFQHIKRRIFRSIKAKKEAAGNDRTDYE